MKTRIFSLILLSILLLGACKPKTVAPSFYAIHGTVDSKADSVLYAVTITDSASFKTDTIRVQGGRFTLQGASDSLVQVNLYYAGRTKMYPLYLQKTDEVSVAVTDSMPDIVISGDTVNTPVYLFEKQTAKDSVGYALNLLVSEFVNKHTDNPAALIVIKNRMNALALTPERIKRLLNKLQEPAKAPLLLEQIATIEKISETLPLNQKMPFITFRDQNEKRFPIMNNKGSFTLITFWASWDSLSVQRVKQLKGLAAKYKERPLEVFTISFDKNDSIFKAKVKEYDIPGNNILMEDNFNNDIVQKLGIRTIPSNIIADTNVVVVRKNLFGDELSDFIQENATGRKKNSAKKGESGKKQIDVKSVQKEMTPVKSVTE